MQTQEGWSNVSYLSDPISRAEVLGALGELAALGADRASAPLALASAYGSGPLITEIDAEADSVTSDGSEANRTMAYADRVSPVFTDDASGDEGAYGYGSSASSYGPGAEYDGGEAVDVLGGIITRVLNNPHIVNAVEVGRAGCAKGWTGRWPHRQLRSVRCVCMSISPARAGRPQPTACLLKPQNPKTPKPHL